MDNRKKEQVLEILRYWKIVELTEQQDIPRESSDNSKLIKSLERKGKKEDLPDSSKEDVKSKKKRIEIFKDITDFLENKEKKIDIKEAMKEEDKIFLEYPEKKSEISFVIGRIERNKIVDYLEKYMKNYDVGPEISYPMNSEIAWFSFKTDNEGNYVEHSFQLSPILWAIYVWEKKETSENQNFDIEIDKYEDEIKDIDKELMKIKDIDKFLYELYETIYFKYVKGKFNALSNFSENKLAKVNFGMRIYTRYSDKKALEANENEQDYSDLGRSFFINDIILLSDKIKNDQFGNNEYEKKVIEYILSGYEKTKGSDTEFRTEISPHKDKKFMRDFFENVLNIGRAPKGKWPAKFMPALMQQVAINLAITPRDNTPIFSVNGPPGTGKTTLLKDIIASNIVERAKLLAKYEDPDEKEVFIEHEFINGPYYDYAPSYFSFANDKINDYGMLVTSCNNAAVENITKDLPKAGDILESLESDKNENPDVGKGLEEIKKLFTLEKSDDIEEIKFLAENEDAKKKKVEIAKIKDIYFTRYANNLLGNDNCWGLISAPLGKKSNIRQYVECVLKPFKNDYLSGEIKVSHKKKYTNQRELFLKQWDKVAEMEKEIQTLCDSLEEIPYDIKSKSQEEIENYIDSCNRELKDIAEEIEKINKNIRDNEIEIKAHEDSQPKNFFSKLFESKSKKAFRESVIASKEEDIGKLKGDRENRQKYENKINREKEDYEKFLAILNRLREYSGGNKKLTPVDNRFMELYLSKDEKEATKAQVINPWFTPEYNREREKLFFYACKLQKEFVISSKKIMQNIQNILIAWNMHSDVKDRMTEEDRKAAMPVLLQTLFLITPVISTTFASAQTFLKDVEKSGTIGTLIVDEAGQAPPQMAIGSLYRCRKAMIVGDPKQIEPVVTAECDMIKQLFNSKLLEPYKDKRVSVQGFADYLNPYGTYLGQGSEREWVGCPLVVHRRCIDPMYSISNVLSYDNTMKQQTASPKEKKIKTFILDNSYWIDVEGSEEGNKNHFVKAQGKIVIELLKKKIAKVNGNKEIKLFIITPFTSVKFGMQNMIKNLNWGEMDEVVKNWAKNNIGTVHTFQGQGTDEVIFLLGCDKNSISAANWVNKNIVNVAVTRAKYRVYIIGDRDVWSCKPVAVARENLVDNIIDAEKLEELLKA